MFDTLKTTVCQIAVFMICAQAIAHFRPKESYEKYLRMLLSVMILIQIFQPFCKLFFGVTGQELSASVESFQRELDISMEEAAEQSVLAGEKLETMSLLEVQERMVEQEELAEREKLDKEENVEKQEKMDVKEEVEEQEKLTEKENVSGLSEQVENNEQSEKIDQVEQVQIQVELSGE